MRVRISNRMAAGVIALVVLLTAGLAIALWSSDGSGSGDAAAISAQTVTVDAATGAADLYPGNTQGDVHFTLTNDNPYPIRFTDMTPGAVTSSDPTNCPASNVTVGSETDLTLDVAANATSGAQSIADVVTMVSGAPDGCQGVTFTIALDLTGTQV